MTTVPPEFTLEVNQHFLACAAWPEVQRQEVRLEAALKALIEKGYTVESWQDHAAMTTKYRAFLPKPQIP